MLEPTDFSEFPTEYPNYFPGQYLLADDFKLQHDYLSYRLRYHNRSLHVSGIIEGLEVTVADGDKSVLITRGSAIDDQGNLIVLKEEQEFNAFNGLSEGELYIQYDEQLAEKQQDGVDNSYTRSIETPIFGFADPTPEHCVKLAKLKISSDLISDNDPNIREYSGVYLPSSNGTALTLRYQGNADHRAVFTGSLKIDGDLTLQNGVAVNNISSNANLGDNNDTTISTTKAIKSYVDSKVEEDGEWETLKLINGWTNQDSNELGYFKDSSGIVHLKGVLKYEDLIQSKTAFQLPGDCKPSTDCYYPVGSYPPFSYEYYQYGPFISYITISAGTGDVKYICRSVLNNAVMYLDGITFRAA
ncbi:hypothetical protein [Okeania sp. KiyG1]|uniref:hypothetical protein n=1 Tax=Okeania sp. KiyG1 TaxID=2720165 RepID=UPI0019227D96|nr:hypothetical protein [Okeania sp. KiyG1]GGA02231.1 hypothetical protein CYANOKiyG1_14240 [Okeania sp. KiyG1]